MARPHTALWIRLSGTDGLRLRSWITNAVRWFPSRVCTYGTYIPNRTISLPDDVTAIIASLDVPFSQWVADQLRRHAAASRLSLSEQLLVDAALAGQRGLKSADAQAIGQRIERAAPW